MKTSLMKICAISTLAFTLSACATSGSHLSAQQKNAAIGAVVGGVAGNLIGGDTGATLGGAALGGVIGSQIKR